MIAEMEEKMKKTKFITKAKRLLSSFVATAMSTTMLATISAFTATSTSIYTYDG